MTTARLGIVTALATALLVAGCSSSGTGGTAAASSAPEPSPSASASSSAPQEVDLGALAASQNPTASGSADPLTQWCNSYAFLSNTIADAGTNPANTDTALRALERFRQLWVLGGNAELLNPDETDANLRAVAAYTAVIEVVAKGGSETSPEFLAAKKAVTATTEEDHKLLQSSAGKIVGYCGAPSASASPAAS